MLIIVGYIHNTCVTQAQLKNKFKLVKYFKIKICMIKNCFFSCFFFFKCLTLTKIEYILKMCTCYNRRNKDFYQIQGSIQKHFYKNG